MNELKKSLEGIKMPEEMKERIIRNCRLEAEKTAGAKRLRLNRCVIIAAVICLCLGAVVGAAGRAGFFRDIIRWDGAVTGAVYEQASEEIALTAKAVDDRLIVVAVLLKSKDAPYSELDSLGIADWHITDAGGNNILRGAQTDMYRINGEKAEIEIQLPDMAAGNYTLYVDAFLGGCKADQPLNISGGWKCGFDI